MIRFLLMIILSLGSLLSAQESCRWEDYDTFKSYYLSQEGRVIDPYQGRNITTSEGQSYALFFALVANQPDDFEKIFNWIQNNLAKGDISAHLPAWLWGLDQPQDKSSPKWRVLDDNSASDADLWIAYTLIEAGRLWKKRHYSVLGVLLLARILQEEVVQLPNLAYVVLPGKKGFIHQTDQGKIWRLNPSYTPLQLLNRFVEFDPIWASVQAMNVRLLQESAPNGLAPDWVTWLDSKSWQFMSDMGGYDAIRVYLWIGMLPETDPLKATLMQHYDPMRVLMRSVVLKGLPPEQVNILKENSKLNVGPIGFSAALLPFLSQDADLLAIQRQRLHDSPITSDAYFTTVLRLFGAGFDDHMYRFNEKGELLPKWSQECANL